MAPHLYRFRNRWTIDAPADAVYKTLVDVEGYVDWWADIREIRRTDADSGFVTCRSFLPFSLSLQLSRGIEDPIGRQLRVEIDGDLQGYCAAVLADGRGRTEVLIEQEVVMRKPTLLRLEALLRPVLRVNHGVMMWRGERGLRAALG